MTAHPDRQLCLGYFGTADPKYYHLDYVLLPIGNFGLPNPDQTHINGLQPVIALSAVALQGYVLTPAQFQVYAPFQQQQPIAILGGSMYLFDPLKPEETP